MKSLVLLACTAAAASAFAQGRDNFILQQTQGEVQRVSGQLDVLQSNFEEVQRRLVKLEGRGADTSVQAEITALKSSVAELRREMRGLREEIVRDLTGRLSKMQSRLAPPPKPTVQTVSVGPHREYVVQSGDTLSFIAETFGTTVSRIKEMNGLKGDGLRVGQKLVLPLK